VIQSLPLNARPDIVLQMEGSETYNVLADERGRLAGRISVGALSLLIANASLLFVFIAFDVTLFQLIIVFWLESFWIGLFSAIKLIAASILGDPYGNRYVEFSRGANLLTSIFAIGFVSAEFLALFGIVGMALVVASNWFTGNGFGDVVREDVEVVLGSALLFLVGHGISFFTNFIALGEYKTARVGTLLSLPFRRCIALLAAIVFAFAATYFVPGFSNTVSFAALLILLKLLWDYRLHLKERKALSA